MVTQSPSSNYPDAVNTEHSLLMRDSLTSESDITHRIFLVCTHTSRLCVINLSHILEIFTHILLFLIDDLSRKFIAVCFITMNSRAFLPQPERHKLRRE
jgi:hypothetical protein